MKVTRKVLRRLIIEALLQEEKGDHVGEAKTDKKTADHVAKHIVGPQKGKPAFKIFPDKIEGHAGYEVHLTNKGAIGGGLHGELVDPKTGDKIEGGIHIEIPGLSDGEGIHAGAEAEISKAIMGGNLNIFAKGEASAHIGSDHGKVHIGHPEFKGKIGIHGTFGKKHHKGDH
tara:strand:- start:29 stop:544 length:516 start_codon:yes stop_codon:yes gene_type:complete